MSLRKAETMAEAKPRLRLDGADSQWHPEGSLSFSPTELLQSSRAFNPFQEPNVCEARIVSGENQRPALTLFRRNASFSRGHFPRYRKKNK